MPPITDQERKVQMTEQEKQRDAYMKRPARKFRLLAGIHSGFNLDMEKQTWDKVGCTINTRQDLLKLNSSGAVKFEEIGGSPTDMRASHKDKPQSVNGPGANLDTATGGDETGNPENSEEAKRNIAKREETAGDDADSGTGSGRNLDTKYPGIANKSISELRAIADAEEIDLEGASNKQQILAKLREA